MSPNIGGRINGGPRGLNQLCPPRSPAEAQGSAEETGGAGVQNLLGLDGHWVSALGKLGKDSGRRNSKKFWLFLLCDLRHFPPFSASPRALLTSLAHQRVHLPCQPQFHLFGQLWLTCSLVQKSPVI